MRAFFFCFFLDIIFYLSIIDSTAASTCMEFAIKHRFSRKEKSCFYI
jgi:hypothetical protein